MCRYHFAAIVVIAVGAASDFIIRTAMADNIVRPVKLRRGLFAMTDRPADSHQRRIFAES